MKENGWSEVFLGENKKYYCVLGVLYKECKTCKKVIALSSYPNVKNCVDGKRGSCKGCRSRSQEQSFKKRKELYSKLTHIKCIDCKIEKSIMNFSVPNNRCKTCASKKSRERRHRHILETNGEIRKTINKQATRWRKLNPESGKNSWLFSTYGIRLDDYKKMQEEQNNLCAICLRPERTYLGAKLKDLAVDHCHATGKIRGLLCAACNIALGTLDDSIEILQSAIDYLKKHK